MYQSEIKSLQDKLFGRKTEKIHRDDGQLSLFDMPVPENLPRIQCGCGCLKTRSGQEVSEQLDIIPAKMQVIRNIRYKYACKNCEGVEDDGPTISIARMPEQMIPKSMATPGLLAHILVAKFADAQPFYRQEKQFARIGVELPRSVKLCWALCRPISSRARWMKQRFKY